MSDTVNEIGGLAAYCSQVIKGQSRWKGKFTLSGMLATEMGQGGGSKG